ncbi:hypothetical protein PMAYCL1PPCAC_17870, partial [Pristionchus mayeri]
SVHSLMISPLLFPLLISSIDCGLYSGSLDVYRNGNIDLRSGNGGEHVQLINGVGSSEWRRGEEGAVGGSYATSINYLSSQFADSSFDNRSQSACHPSSSSRPVALVINSYSDSQLEQSKLNEHDNHYSRPIKYRPPPNRIAPSENWYASLLPNPHPPTPPPPLPLPSISPLFTSSPYQPDMSKYRY